MASARQFQADEAHSESPTDRDSQPESVFAVWHDPTTYDIMRHGPPYLPSAKVVKVATSREAIKNVVRPLVEKVSADALTSMLVILQHIKSEFAEHPLSGMATLLAFLRAESMIHQAHHWQAAGENYYGDHLLFDRLYSSVVEDIDKLAERMVGSGEAILAQPVLHARHTSAVVQMFYDGAPPAPSSDEHVLLSLRAALRTLALMKIVYGALSAQGLLSHGTDNLLQGIADKHEEHVYLLKQRATKNTSTYDRRAFASRDARWKAE